MNGYTLELSLKDSVSAGLKEMTRALSNVRKLVDALRADVSALNGETGEAVAGTKFGALAGGVGEQLEGLAKGALADLDAAFRNSGETLAAYHAERRRQAKETSEAEREGAEEQAGRMDRELENQKELYALQLEMLAAYNKQHEELTKARTERETEIRKKQDEEDQKREKEKTKKEQEEDQKRLKSTQTFADDMAQAMKGFYESGMAQSQTVYRMYQAFAVAEATISTYKAAQEAYANGMGWGGPVVGAVMAAAAVAAGMARVATIKSTKPKGYAFGGLIDGSDRGDRADNVLIRATPGEYMLDRPAVRRYGVPALEALRRGAVPREALEPFAAPRLPVSVRRRTAYASGGEIGTDSLTERGGREDGLTVINVMDFQREFDRALASTRGRRVLINILGEEGIAS